MNKANYLIVHKDYPLSITGVNAGAEMATLYLATHLAKQGCNVVVAAQLKEGEQTVAGVEYWELGETYDVAGAFQRAESHFGDYNLISCGKALPILTAAQFSGVQTKILISQDRTSNDTGISAPVLSAAVDRIVCVSNAQRDFFVEDGADPQKVCVVHNGADQDIFTVQTAENRDLKKLVFAGALVQDKGIHLLIESFAQLKGKHPELTLDVYGSAKMWGRDRFIDEEQIAKSLPGITFHGAVPRERVAEAYRGAGIAVVPSIWFDPFPLTSVEAQVTGCPVVTFNVGGLGEGVIHDKTGIVIDQVQGDILTQQLDMLLSNPERLKEMSRQAIELQRPRYTWDAFAEAMIEICKEEEKKVSGEAESGLIKKRLGLFSTWNQECGLATYARYLFQDFDPASYVVFAEDCESDRTADDGDNVERCWKKGETDWSAFLTSARKHDVGLLHINIHSPITFQPAPFVDALQQLQAEGRKIILHLHSIFTLRPEARELFQVADRVLVHSPEVRLEAIAHGARPSDTHTFAHGIEVQKELTADERRALRKKLSFEETEKALICFGFIQPHKGIEELIEGVASLRRQGVNAKGYVAGRPNQADPNAESYFQGLRELAQRLGVSDQIIFFNRFLENNEVTEYLQAADLVLMNYRSGHYEASGACSLALGAGAAIATSLAPPFAGYGDAVWHMSSGFSSAVSLQLLLQDETLQRELRTNARQYAEEHSWSAMSVRLREVYKACGFQPTRVIEERREVEKKQGVQERTARILIQNRSNMYTHRGGDTVVIDRLVEGLKSRGIDVTVDTECTQDPSGYDLVHLINFALPTLVETLGKRAQERGVPFVVTTLCEDIPSFHNQSLASAKQLVEYVQYGQQTDWWTTHAKDPQAEQPCAPFANQWAAQHARALFVNGDAEAQVLHNTYNNLAPIMNIPIGYEVGAQAGPELFEQEYGERDFVFCVGRFESRKNQLMLLKALEQSELTVVLASGGFSYQEEYDQAVRNFKRKGKTIILERVSAEMLASAYAAAKVHVLPSWYELPGLVSLEAASQGCNVVVTENGTARDYFKDYAFYCNPADEHSVRNAVIAGYYAPYNAELGQIVRGYSWDTFVEQTVRLYESIAPQRELRQSSASVAQTTVSQEGCSDEVLRLIDEGQAAAKNKDLASAHEFFTQAEKLAPNELRVVRNRAAVFMASENLEKAEEYFKRAYEISENDPRTLSGLGMCSMMRKSPEDAYPYFVRALEVDPLQLVAILQLMECAYSLGRFDDLRRVLEHYVVACPEDIDMRFCLAGALYQLGEKSEALRHVQIVRNQNEAHVGARELQEQIEKDLTESASLGQQIEKESHAAEKVSVPFDSIDLVLSELEDEKRKRNYELVFERLQELEKAQTMNEAQKERSDILTAEVRGLLGERDEAQDIFESILKRNPRSARALCGVGAIRASHNEWDEAKNRFEQALSIQPDLDVALAGLGMCATSAGEHDTAWDYYQKALEKNPENTRALYGIIEIGYALKRYLDVEHAIQQYLDYHPADLDFLYSLAGCYFAQEKLDEATSEVNKILIFNSEHKNAKELQLAIESKRNEAPASRL